MMKYENDTWFDNPNERPWIAAYPKSVRPHLDYPDRPLGWLLEQANERVPDRIACHFYAQRLSYAELYQMSRRLASSLRNEGIEPGDRVGVLLPNMSESLVALFGIWMAGGVAVSVSPLMVQEEANALLGNTNTKLVITLDLLSGLVCGGSHKPEHVYLVTIDDRLSFWKQLALRWIRFRKFGFEGICPRMHVRDFAEVIESGDPDESWPEPDPDSPAYILPTGGTTSSPKAVTLSHRNLIANAEQVSHWLGAEYGSETVLALLPFFHSYGLTTCLTGGVATGSTLILHQRFDPRTAVDLIEEYRPTLFPAVPAMLKVMLTKVLRRSKRDLSSLRYVMSGGAALPRELAEEFSTMSGCTVVEGYGLSEASPVTHVGPLDGSAVPGTIGLPMPDTDVRIVDIASGTEALPHGVVGELVVRGPQVMLGYWNNPEETQRVLRDGWLYTGDLATMDERGFFHIVDRKKDLIITSGFNVYPADVEEVLRRHPDVEDIAVVGVPDDEKGELVKAIVVPKEGHEFDRDEFDRFTREHLAHHKRPRVVEVLSSDLPRNFLGKVLRRELRDTAPVPSDSELVPANKQ